MLRAEMSLEFSMVKHKDALVCTSIDRKCDAMFSCIKSMIFGVE